MHPSVCFQAGRFTLTQSSWTAVPACSRKWMSGHAALALVVEEDRRRFATTIRNRSPLGEPFPPSAGKSPLSLDSYLSWMSPVYRPRFIPGLSTSVSGSASWSLRGTVSRRLHPFEPTKPFFVTDARSISIFEPRSSFFFHPKIDYGTHPSPYSDCTLRFVC
jgi:hypothetical protein